jgi:hypothetical protein
MSWTVACFCGTVYTTPPNRCDICGRSIGEFAPPTIRPRIADELAANELDNPQGRADSGGLDEPEHLAARAREQAGSKQLRNRMEPCRRRRARENPISIANGTQ